MRLCQKFFEKNRNNNGCHGDWVILQMSSLTQNYEISRRTFNEFLAPKLPWVWNSDKILVPTCYRWKMLDTCTNYMSVNISTIYRIIGIPIEKLFILYTYINLKNSLPTTIICNYIQVTSSSSSMREHQLLIFL